MKITMTHWKMDDEDMAEWHKETKDEFFEFADFYEGEAAKASKELREIIDSSDPLMCSWRVQREEEFVDCISS